LLLSKRAQPKSDSLNLAKMVVARTATKYKPCGGGGKIPPTVKQSGFGRTSQRSQCVIVITEGINELEIKYILFFS